MIDWPGDEEHWQWYLQSILEGYDADEVGLDREGDAGPGDHLLAEGSEAVRAEPPLVVREWLAMDDSGAPPAPGDDRRAGLYNRGGDYFGNLFVYATEGAFNAHRARITTDPDDLRWYCAAWLRATEEFALDGLVASFGFELGFGGRPLVLVPPAAPAYWLVWPTAQGGVLAHVNDPARACGGCIGCRALVPNREQRAASWVYFIRSEAGGPVKIGYSANPEGRLAALQVAHAEPLRIVARLPGGVVVERALHRLFADDRVRPNGEWFRPSPALLAFVGEIGGGG